MRVLVVLPFEKDCDLDLLEVKENTVVQSFPHTFDLCYLLNLNLKANKPRGPEILNHVRSRIKGLAHAECQPMKTEPAIEMVLNKQLGQCLNKTVSWLCQEPILGPVVLYLTSGRSMTETKWQEWVDMRIPYSDFLHLALLQFSPCYVQQVLVEQAVVTTSIKDLPCGAVTQYVLKLLLQWVKVGRLELEDALTPLKGTTNHCVRHILLQDQDQSVCEKFHVFAQGKLLSEFPVLGQHLKHRLTESPETHCFIQVVLAPFGDNVYVRFNVDTHIVLVNYNRQFQWYEVALDQESHSAINHKLCGQCFAGPCKLKCQCKQVYYCNQVCQAKHWNTHKVTCSQVHTVEEVLD